MMLSAAVSEFCQLYGKNRIWIAFSGGLDSQVLLHVCQAVRHEVSAEFNVLHVHHGLSHHADEWAAHAAAICQQYQINFHLIKVKINKNSANKSLEEAARTERYRAFATFIQENDLLLTAHHQDDQAETILLQLLRGAGPKGLAAMPEIKPFALGKLGRPLLRFSRQQLQDYATTHQLAWVDDESNQNVALTRNFIRHDIMPLLKARWPSVESVLARSAEHCAESQALLEETAGIKLTEMAGGAAGTLSIKKLLACSEAWQRLLLRCWITRQGHALPDTQKLLAVQKCLLTAAQDRYPSIEWQNCILRRYRDDLHLLTSDQSQRLAGVGLKLDPSQVTIRVRQPGESVEVLNRGKIALKNLFQEWGVPAWERGTLPLVFYGYKLIEAPGYFRDPAYF